jgi:hypothetical protein
MPPLSEDIQRGRRTRATDTTDGSLPTPTPARVPLSPRRAATPPPIIDAHGHVDQHLVKLQDTINSSEKTVHVIRKIIKNLDGLSILRDEDALTRFSKVLRIDYTHPSGNAFVRSLLTWNVLLEEFERFKDAYLSSVKGWKGEKAKPCYRVVEIMVKAPKAAEVLKATPRDTWSVNNHYAHFILEAKRRMYEDIYRVRGAEQMWLYQDAARVEDEDIPLWDFYHVLLFWHMRERAILRKETQRTRRAWLKVRRLPVWRRVDLWVDRRKDRVVYRKDYLKYHIGRKLSRSKPEDEPVR